MSVRGLPIRGHALNIVYCLEFSLKVFGDGSLLAIPRLLVSNPARCLTAHIGPRIRAAPASLEAFYIFRTIMLTKEIVKLK